MRILRVAAIFCVLGVFALPARSQDSSTENVSTGNYLIGACHLLISWADNSSTYVSASDQYKSGYCLGEVFGVTATLEANHQACVPGSVTIGQEVRVVEKSLKDHPAKLNESGPDLITQAIEKAFPCK